MNLWSKPDVLCFGIDLERTNQAGKDKKPERAVIHQVAIAMQKLAQLRVNGIIDETLKQVVIVQWKNKVVTCFKCK